MTKVGLGAALLVAALAPAALQVARLNADTTYQRATAQAQATAQPGLPMARFLGTWVGTQAWAIADPPPGARADQAVTLVIEQIGNTLVGTMTPFMGGEDGSSFTEATIVGDELQAVGVVGKPRPAAAAGRRGASGGAAGGGAGGWKDPITINFALKNDGVNLIGTADVLMGDVKWMKFRYDLSKKRSRY